MTVCHVVTRHSHDLIVTITLIIRRTRVMVGMDIGKLAWRKNLAGDFLVHDSTLCTLSILYALATRSSVLDPPFFRHWEGLAC